MAETLKSELHTFELRSKVLFFSNQNANQGHIQTYIETHAVRSSSSMYALSNLKLQNLNNAN